jgi:hypothetical protein
MLPYNRVRVVMYLAGVVYKPCDAVHIGRIDDQVGINSEHVAGTISLTAHLRQSLALLTRHDLTSVSAHNSRTIGASTDCMAMQGTRRERDAVRSNHRVGLDRSGGEDTLAVN